MEDMEPHARVARCVFQWERITMELCGHCFIGKPFKPNFITYLVYTLVIIAIFGSVYTIIFYDMSAKLFCVLLILMMFQAIGKIYHIRYQDDYLWILNFIQNLYNVHAKTESHKRAKYLGKFAFFTEFLFKFLACVLLLAEFSFFIAPIYMYVVENKLVPLIPLYMPGIDETTTTGYILLLCLHSIQILMSVIGFIAFEFLLEIIVINALILGKLIALDTELMSNDLEDEMQLDAICRLGNIFRMHQEMAEYMDRIDKVTFKVIFIHLSTASFGAIVCLVGVLLLKFFLVAGILFGLLLQILVNCLLGNCVEMSHDQIYDAALQLKWYLLPLKEQRFYRFYIECCQGPTMLTVGGFSPLNMGTAHKIYSKIYSITMFLMMMAK